jgi:plasmid stabilization system protein ParE
VTIYFSPEAEADLVAVVEHLAKVNPRAAAELGRRVFEIVDRLVRGDFEGPEQPLQSGEIVRSWPVPPVRIYYKRREEAFWVLRIYHQAQAPIVR